MPESNGVQPKSFEEARRQACEYMGVVMSEILEAPNGEKFEIPNLSMLDDDQRMRYDQVKLDSESWDHHPESETEVRQQDGTTVKVKIPAELKMPHRKTNTEGKPELVEHYDIQCVKAVLGNRYAAFKKAGGHAAMVTMIWHAMNKKMGERQRADTFPDAGDRPVGALPEADQG